LGQNYQKGSRGYQPAGSNDLLIDVSRHTHPNKAQDVATTVVHEGSHFDNYVPKMTRRDLYEDEVLAWTREGEFAHAKGMQYDNAAGKLWRANDPDQQRIRNVVKDRYFGGDIGGSNRASRHSLGSSETGLQRYKRNQWRQADHDVNNPAIQSFIDKGYYPRDVPANLRRSLEESAAVRGRSGFSDWVKTKETPNLKWTKGDRSELYIHYMSENAYKKSIVKDANGKIRFRVKTSPEEVFSRTPPGIYFSDAAPYPGALPGLDEEQYLRELIAAHNGIPYFRTEYYVVIDPELLSDVKWVTRDRPSFQDTSRPEYILPSDEEYTDITDAIVAHGPTSELNR
jgi:hypothetical protein